MKPRTILLMTIMAIMLSSSAFALSEVNFTQPATNDTYIRGTYVLSTVTDTAANVSFYYNNGTAWVFIGKNGSLATVQNFSWDTTAVSDGNYRLSANATNGTVNVTNSSFWVNIDNTAPNVTAMSPSNNSDHVLGGNITFTVTVNDASQLKNVTLYTDYGGSWVANVSNASVTGTSANVTLVFTDSGTEGPFNWNVLVYDQAGNSAWYTGNLTLYVNNDGVDLYSLSPADGTLINYVDLDICFEPRTDGYDIAECALTTNGDSHDPYESIARSGESVCFDNIDASVYEDMTLTATIVCTDDYTTKSFSYSYLVGIYGGGGSGGGGSATTGGGSSTSSSVASTLSAIENTVTSTGKTVGKWALWAVGGVVALYLGYLALPYAIPIALFMISNPVGWIILTGIGLIVWLMF